MQQTAQTAAWNSSRYTLFAALLVVDSFHYIFARLLLPHLHPTVSAFFVLAVATAEVAAFAGLRRQLRWQLARTHFWFFATVGALVAASTVLSYLSISYLDPGTASMLGKTGILFSLLLSIFWLHEQLSQTQLLGGALALIGAATLSYHPGTLLQWGALLILASTLLYSMHTAVVKQWGGSMDLLNFFVFRLLSTSIFLALFAANSGHWRWPDPPTWLLLGLAGTIDVTVSRTLYYQTLRIFPMSLHTIVLMLSPVVSIVASLLLFGDFPTPQGLAGGLLVLAGVWIVNRGK